MLREIPAPTVTLLGVASLVWAPHHGFQLAAADPAIATAEVVEKVILGDACKCEHVVGSYEMSGSRRGCLRWADATVAARIASATKYKTVRRRSRMKFQLT